MSANNRAGGWRIAYKKRPRTFDRRIACLGCGASVGVRVINPTLSVVAAHSIGKRRVVAGVPAYAASSLAMGGA